MAHGKKAEIARGQGMSSLVGHDQEFRFYLLAIRSHEHVSERV